MPQRSEQPLAHAPAGDGQLPAGWIVAALTVALAAGLGAGGLLGLVGLTNQVVILAGLVVGAGLALLAATRFWWVVVGLCVVRSSLDALKLGHAASGSSAFDPGVIVGITFLASGALWLIAQRRSGSWVKLSHTSSWFMALAGACTLSAIGSGNPLQSVQVSLKVWAGALMFAVLEQAFRQRPERGRHVLAAGALSLVVPAVVAFRQLTGPKQLEDYLAVSRIRGTFVHSNPFATYLVILAVVAVAVRRSLAGKARLAADLVALTATTFTLFTYARGAWIALLLGLVIVGAKIDRRILVAMALAVVVVAVAVPSVTARLSDLDNQRVEGRGDPNSLAWRVQYWGRLLPRTAENPLTGIGLEQVLATSPEKLMPHNVFVQTTVETGLIGLTCLIGLCLSMAIDLRRAIRRAKPGLPQAVAVGAAGAALGVFSQLGSENLLTQAAIHWYLAIPVVWAIVANSPELDARAAYDASLDDTAPAAAGPTLVAAG